MPSGSILFEYYFLVVDSSSHSIKNLQLGSFVRVDFLSKQRIAQMISISYFQSKIVTLSCAKKLEAPREELKKSIDFLVIITALSSVAIEGRRMIISITKKSGTLSCSDAW